MQVQVVVDRQGSISSSLLFTCYGWPPKSTQLELVGGSYRPAADLCPGRKILVAFNQEPTQFLVWYHNGSMYQFPVQKSIMRAAAGMGVYDYEILTSFFAAQQLSPVFKDNFHTWGHYDAELGRWLGAVGMVSTIISVVY